MNLNQSQKHQNRQVIIKQALQKFAEVNGKVVEDIAGSLSKIINPISSKIWVLFLYFYFSHML
ncbi:MAG: Uncharacterised protein [Porticoccaceae bacterium UBA1117]|nr:MAG: Uncharacterised protein [Porticoccaceae bacterium UBA1117]